MQATNGPGVDVSQRFHELIELERHKTQTAIDNFRLLNALRLAELEVFHKARAIVRDKSQPPTVRALFSSLIQSFRESKRVIVDASKPMETRRQALAALLSLRTEDRPSGFCQTPGCPPQRDWYAEAVHNY